MGRIIGIDLGTTNSLAAVWEDGKSVLIPNEWGGFLTPSVVSIDEYNTAYAGRGAWERLFAHPDNTVAAFKRHMGTNRAFSFSGWEYTAEELSALVLKKIRQDAERYLGETVEEAVISVPAYFDDKARRAVKDAGLLAGLKVERLINEPSAAALACRTCGKNEEETMLVFDFGGGTLDISLVDCFDNVIEIAAICGDNHLGGREFDTVIAMEFCKRAGRHFTKLSAGCRAALLHEAEECKKCLSREREAMMSLDMPELCYETAFTNEALMGISSEIFSRMEIAIRGLRFEAPEGREFFERGLDKIITIGGTSKMPVVREYLAQRFPDIPIQMADPETIVARGMGVYAGIRERQEDVKDLLLTDICPFSIKAYVLDKEGGARCIEMIERNAALPTAREAVIPTFSDNQKNVKLRIFQGTGRNPEEDLYLGKLKIGVPDAPAGQESITLRLSYDIDGILLAEVRVDSTGRSRQKVMLSRGSRLTEENIMHGVARLNKLSIHSGDGEGKGCRDGQDTGTDHVIEFEKWYEENVNGADI